MALTGPVVSEEMFQECGRWMNSGACLYYKLTYELKGSGELKRGVQINISLISPGKHMYEYLFEVPQQVSTTCFHGE